VPILGDIPVMGKLFSSTEDTIVTTETIILITPHLINNEQDKVLADEVKKVEKSEEKMTGEREALHVTTFYEDDLDEDEHDE
jgi:type II secretory pathway component GspD/PulD (secretin)